MTSKKEKTIRIEVNGVRVECVRGTASYVRRVFRAADDEGTIQATAMIGLSDDPRDHTTTSMTRLLAAVGARVVEWD